MRLLRLLTLSLAINVIAAVADFGVSNAHAQISLLELRKIEAAFHAEYDEELAAQGASFFINKPPTPNLPTFWWNRPEPRASYGSYVDKLTGHREHYIFFFSGFGSLPHMTPDAAVMTICHELGHGLAGPPYKDGFPGEAEISIEAMADDYAVRVCFPRMAKRIPAPSFVRAVENAEFVTKECETRFHDTDSRQYCRRVFAALEFERHYYRTSPDILEETSFEAKDPSVVTKIETKADYYPHSQCRIDTMVAALFNERRPRCWWPEATESMLRYLKSSNARESVHR